MIGDETEIEWEYAERWDYCGEVTYEKISREKFAEHKPTGYRTDGTPYWNYTTVRRVKAGPWTDHEPVSTQSEETP